MAVSKPPVSSLVVCLMALASHPSWAGSASLTITDLQLQAIDLRPDDGLAPSFVLAKDTAITDVHTKVPGLPGTITGLPEDLAPGWLSKTDAAVSSAFGQAEAHTNSGTDMQVSCALTTSTLGVGCESFARAFSPNPEAPFGATNLTIAPFTSVRFTGHLVGDAALDGQGCAGPSPGSASCETALFQFVVWRDGVDPFIGGNGRVDSFNDGLNATLHKDTDFSFDLANNSDNTVNFALFVTAYASVQAATVIPLPVPEPASAYLAVLGLAGLVFANRRRTN